MTTLSTVGYGDVSASTNTERVICILWMSFGMIFISFTIGSLSAMMSGMDSKENSLMNRLNIIDEFAKEANLDSKL